MSMQELIALYHAAHPESPLRWRQSERNELAIALSGELDMKLANDLAPILEAVLLESPVCGRLLLDLSGVAYISSAGVGLLAAILAKAEKRSISLVLVNPTAGVKRVMDTLGLLSFFDVERRDE